MIRALIFDFDGLILDTEKNAYQSWQEIYAEYERELPMQEWAKCIGNSDFFDPLEYLEGLIGNPIERDGLGERRSKRHMELIEQSVALPGVELYLQEAKRLGLRLAVASSSPRDWVEGHLTRLGLLPFFDAICTGDEVLNRKPDPELFLKALRALGVTADGAIVLEDSPNGILAANRAKIFAVAVPNPITSQLPLDHANLRLASMADIPLEELIKVVEERQVSEEHGVA